MGIEFIRNEYNAEYMYIHVFLYSFVHMDICIWEWLQVQSPKWT